MKKIKFVKRMYLKYLTLYQEDAIKNYDFERYYKLTAKHFKSYFGITIEEAFKRLPTYQKEVEAIKDRHARLVINNCLSFNYSNGKLKKQVFNNLKDSFLVCYMFNKTKVL